MSLQWLAPALLVLVALWFFLDKWFRKIVSSVHALASEQDQRFLRVFEEMQSVEVARRQHAEGLLQRVEVRLAALPAVAAPPPAPAAAPPPPAPAVAVPPPEPAVPLAVSTPASPSVVAPPSPRLPDPEELVRLMQTPVNPGDDVLRPAAPGPLDVLVVDLVAAEQWKELRSRFPAARATVVSTALPGATPDQGVSAVDEAKWRSQPSGSFDYIVCTGEGHHHVPIRDLLYDLQRLLRPGGRATVSVYNYDSIWTHLYHAWCRSRIADPTTGALLQARPWLERRILGASHDRTAFAELADRYGFEVEERGGYMSALEKEIVANKELARADASLDPRHAAFLASLQTGDGKVTSDGRWAGWKTVYEITLVHDDSREAIA